MTSLITNSVTKTIKQDLSRNEKETTESDIQQRPPIVQSSHYE